MVFLDWLNYCDYDRIHGLHTSHFKLDVPVLEQHQALLGPKVHLQREEDTQVDSGGL